jgi:hypothetical protein
MLYVCKRIYTCSLRCPLLIYLLLVSAFSSTVARLSSVRLRTSKPTESLRNDSLSFSPVASCTRLTSPSIPTSTFSRPTPRPSLTPCHPFLTHSLNAPCCSATLGTWACSSDQTYAPMFVLVCGKKYCIDPRRKAGGRSKRAVGPRERVMIDPVRVAIPT